MTDNPLPKIRAEIIDLSEQVKRIEAMEKTLEEYEALKAYVLEAYSNQGITQFKLTLVPENNGLSLQVEPLE